MRTLILLAIVISMSTLALPQKLPAPQAITDPKLITSKPNANVEQNQQSLSIERLFMTRSVGASTWSPDGKSIAFVSNISGRNNIWLVPATGGWPTQLTVSDQRQTQPAWSPDGKWIAYISDYDGDEQWDIFFVSPKTGQVINITNTREIAEESPTWSPRRALSGLHGEAQDVVGVRNRHLRHPDARHQTPDQRHAQGQDERQSHLVRRQQVDRLHPAAGQGHGLQYLHRRSRHR